MIFYPQGYVQGLARGSETFTCLMNERSLEVWQVLWPIPKLLPAIKFGTLILPTIAVWCPIRAMLVHRDGDSSLFYSHHSASTQACNNQWKAEEKE